MEQPSRADSTDVAPGKQVRHPGANHPSHATPDDATATVNPSELLQRAAHGDPAAWQDIMHRYRGRVIATVGKFRLHHADALDAIQTTWLRLAENIHRIQRPEHLGSWLTATAARECLHLVRDTKRTHTLADAMVGTFAEPTDSPEQQVISTHTGHTLHTLIAQLSPRRRRLLHALLPDHVSSAEISRVTRIPIGSIGPTATRPYTNSNKSSTTTEPDW